MPSKEILVILALLSSLFLVGCQDSSGNVYGYNFDTARITYEISGSSTGTSEVLIKGEKKYIHNIITQTRPNGEVLNMDSIFIQNGPRLYTLNAETKEGSHISTTFYDELKKLSPNERKSRMIADALRDSREVAEQLTDPLKPQQTETIAGQTCELYKNGNIETCLWQGIPLRTVASLPEYAVQTTTTATKIELNQAISESEFEVPTDYQITELN